MSDDSADGERGEAALEPPAKRVRTGLEAATVVAPTPTSRAATPRAMTHGPPDPVTPVPGSLLTTHSMQWSSSDMILESDNEATPPPLSDEGTADEGTIRGSGVPCYERPLTGTTPGPQMENPTVKSHEEQVTEEAPTPPVQDLSPVSPEAKPNPFMANRIFLHPSGVSSPLVRSTVVRDIGDLSLSPTIGDSHSRGSTMALQTLRQEPTTQRSYTFSAAEIRTLVASRGSDEGSGPNKLVFYLDLGLMGGITRWRNFKAGQG